MAVRKASRDDVPLLLPLVAEYWAFEEIDGFDAHAVGVQLGHLLAHPQLGCGWLAFERDSPVGYLLAVRVFSLEHLGITAEIDEFFVRAAHRGAGIGAELLRVAEFELARDGCNNVSLQLSRSNEAARGFYLRNGYSERSRYELLEKTLPGR